MTTSATHPSSVNKGPLIPFHAADHAGFTTQSLLLSSRDGSQRVVQIPKASGRVFQRTKTDWASRKTAAGGTLTDVQLQEWLAYYEGVDAAIVPVVKREFIRPGGQLQCSACGFELPSSAQSSPFAVAACSRLCYVCDKSDGVIGQADGTCVHLGHMSQQQALTALCYGFGFCNFCRRAVNNGIGGLMAQQYAVVRHMCKDRETVRTQIVFIKRALNQDVSQFSTFFVQSEDGECFFNFQAITRHYFLLNSPCATRSSKMALLPSLYKGVRLMEYHSNFYSWLSDFAKTFAREAERRVFHSEIPLVNSSRPSKARRLVQQTGQVPGRGGPV